MYNVAKKSCLVRLDSVKYTVSICEEDGDMFVLPWVNCNEIMGVNIDDLKFNLSSRNHEVFR